MINLRIIYGTYYINLKLFSPTNINNNNLHPILLIDIYKFNKLTS